MSGFPPAPQDRFSFRLWTSGGTGRDDFGGATRAPLDSVAEEPEAASVAATGMAFERLDEPTVEHLRDVR